MTNFEGITYRCSVCHGANVQICKPAFFDPNNNWVYVDDDGEADPLSTFCVDCADNHPIIEKYADGSESTIVGRWA